MKGLAIATSFLTRIPLPDLVKHDSDLAKAVPWFPVVGAGVGAVVGAVRLVADGVWPDAVAATLAVMVGVAMTGALHEDGLADVADGVGGGPDPVRRREIMKDSRLGTYGVTALVLSMALRIGLISAMSGGFVVALAAVHSSSRGASAVMMARGGRSGGMVDAYSEGLHPGSRLLAWAVGVAIPLGLLGWSAWPLPVIGLGVAVTVGGWARRKLGVIGGDVLGAIQQIAELTMLLWLVAR